MSEIYDWEKEDDFTSETRFDVLIDKVCDAMDGLVFYRVVYGFMAVFATYMLWQVVRVV